MALTGDQLQLVPQPEPQPRPLLAFAPATVGERSSASQRWISQPKGPSAERQAERMAPRFRVLEEALAAKSTSLSGSSAAPDPETIVVFEVISTIPGFIRAVRDIDGLHFISDFLGDEMVPDDDFYYLDEGERSDRTLARTLYLMIMNRAAVDQLLRLFESWVNDPDSDFPRGLAPLKQVFSNLTEVRRWGPQDRINETGLYERLREDIQLKGASGSIKVEIELVWHSSDSKRTTAQQQVEHVLSAGQIVSSCQIPSIRYHALLAEIPADRLQPLLDDMPGNVELLCADDVLFVSPASAMNYATEPAIEDSVAGIDADMPSGSPKIALLDGYPLDNHDYIAGRLIIDDPQDLEREYPRNRRAHGTAMASLIIHGDLSTPARSIGTPLYVYPVMVPRHGLSSGECSPPNRLFVDLIHQAMQHTLGDPEPAAPSVRIVNLSLGDSSRMFIRQISPLARLLDYFAYRHNLLIIVSAGNRTETHPVVEARAIDDPVALDRAIRESLYGSGRNRRLLSPAEATNVVTVGALHSDATDDMILPDTVVDPLLKGSIATYSPVGTGFGQSPKPELHAPGGRTLYQRPLHGRSEVELVPVETPAVGPGLLVAGPTSEGGRTGTLYTSGTSNAAALVTRSSYEIMERLEDLSRSPDSPRFPDAQYHPVLAKAMLIHATMWPPRTDEWAEQLGISGRSRKRELTKFLGFGAIDNTRLANATSNRVTLIGAGSIGADQTLQFGFPLPPSLGARRSGAG